MHLTKARILMLGLTLAALSLAGCASKKDGSAPATAAAITEITSDEQFTAVIEGAGEKLLGFDLYAPWCAPCRALAPMLERIAADNQNRITFYRVNVDKLPQVAQAFRVGGIPLVAFVKKKAVVGGLEGLQPADQYLAAIDEIAPRKSEGAEFKSVDSRQFQDLIAATQPLILDVRTLEEYADGHLEDATLIPVGELSERIADIGQYKNRAVLVYCRSGNRSLAASQILRRHGFQKVYNLKGGLNDWRRTGFVVVHS
jgi:rhodanese-related sulfurtransferase/thiol-disulfide isomerase/thioredoxin